MLVNCFYMLFKEVKKVQISLSTWLVSIEPKFDPCAARLPQWPHVAYCGGLEYKQEHLDHCVTQAIGTDLSEHYPGGPKR